MSKINRNDIIGPLTAEQTNHVWQLLNNAGEATARDKPDYDFTNGDAIFSYDHLHCAWGCFHGRAKAPTISYEDFVAKMFSPNPKWLHTKWDVRSWTTEQKVAFQEECFRLGYGWVEGSKVSFLHATAYNIKKNGMMGYWTDNPMYHFYDPFYGTEKKWEDMFPDSSIEVGNPGQEPQSHDHECWLHYSRTVDACLKCHPEKNLFNKNLYTVKGTDGACDGIPDPSAIRPASELWGILDTARREREYIEEVKRGRK